MSEGTSEGRTATGGSGDYFTNVLLYFLRERVKGGGVCFRMLLLKKTVRHLIRKKHPIRHQLCSVFSTPHLLKVVEPRSPPSYSPPKLTVKLIALVSECSGKLKLPSSDE